MPAPGLHTLYLALAALSGLTQGAPVTHGMIAFDELSSYWEADILPDKSLPKLVMGDNARLWPGGNLLYRLDYDVENNTYVTDIIKAAIEKINEARCVSVTEVGNQAEDYVSVQLGMDFSSHVGRQGGAQVLTVPKDQIDIGSTMHVLMHALGFGHEHNREDRDDYVTVNMTNVKEAARSYFTKYTWSSGYVSDGLMYDYTSIMHSTNVHDTKVNVDITKPVIWRNDGGEELGQRSKLTDGDKQRLQLAYSCRTCELPGHDGLMFRYPGDCRKFYQCSNAITYVMDCPAGLHFSILKNYCDYPVLANCTSALQ